MNIQNDKTKCAECKIRIESIFCHLSREEMEDFDLEKKVCNFQKGDLVFEEDQIPKNLFCINSGKIKIYQLGEEGRYQILRFATQGDVIGYRALLSGEPYSASAATLENAQICVIPKKSFFSVLEENHKISFQLMKVLSRDLKTAESKLTGITQKTVKERLAEALLFLKETYGLMEDGITLNIQLKREEFANVVGTATETIIRLLAEMKKEKSIAFNGKKIQILNTPKLLKEANLHD